MTRLKPKRNLLLSHETPLYRNWLLLVFLLGFAAFWIWMAMYPNNPRDWWLENILIFLALIGLAVTYRWFRFSTLSYLLILLFLAMHTFGAHYAYDANPVDDLLKKWYPFKRNNYDRIVHLAFGLLMIYPVQEFVERVVRPRRGWSYVIAPLIIVTCSAFFELLEMWVSLIVSSELGAMYLGLQGDIWDSQHDTEMTLYGSVFVMGIRALWKGLFRTRKRKRRSVRFKP